MVALEITLGKSKRPRDGILVTPIISVALSFTFTVIAVGPFVLSRYLNRYCTVNSAIKIDNSMKLMCDVLIALAVIATIIAAIFMSASGITPLLIVIILHILWGAATYFFCRKT